MFLQKLLLVLLFINFGSIAKTLKTRKQLCDLEEYHLTNKVNTETKKFRVFSKLLPSFVVHRLYHRFPSTHAFFHIALISRIDLTMNENQINFTLLYVFTFT